MEWGTKALSVFFVLATVGCVAAMTFGGVRLCDKAMDAPPVSRAFFWKAGAYRVEGRIDSGALKELYILLDEARVN